MNKERRAKLFNRNLYLVVSRSWRMASMKDMSGRMIEEESRAVKEMFFSAESFDRLKEALRETLALIPAHKREAFMDVGLVRGLNRYGDFLAEVDEGLIKDGFLRGPYERDFASLVGYAHDCCLQVYAEIKQDPLLASIHDDMKTH